MHALHAMTRHIFSKCLLIFKANGNGVDVYVTVHHI